MAIEPATGIGDRLAGWLAADMVALVDLLDVTDSGTLGRGEVLEAANRLHAALGVALEQAGNGVAGLGGTA